VRYRKASLVLALVSIAISFVCTGCSGRAASSVREPRQFGNEFSVVSESIVDSENHYLSTIKVKAPIFTPGVGHIVKECSGVLISDRLVLTAGHCVCNERKPIAPESPDTTIIDSKSPCVETVYVQLLTYRTGEPLSSDGSVPADESKPYRGKAQVHKDIKLIYRGMETEPGKTVNATIFSHADIATISLEEPILEKVKYVSPAKEEIGHSEKVVLVGFGLPYLGGAIGRDRRYGANYVVSRRVDGATFHVGKQGVDVSETYSGEVPDTRITSGSYLTSGDSGGPCFRNLGDKVELVGIAKSVRAGTLTLSAYTSVFHYLEWLNQRIEESKKGYSN